jgi:hypothetical protein
MNDTFPFSLLENVYKTCTRFSLEIYFQNMLLHFKDVGETKECESV